MLTEMLMMKWIKKLILKCRDVDNYVGSDFDD